jgi:thymidine kinase
MYSSKTTTLMAWLQQHRVAQRVMHGADKCVIVRSTKDSRSALCESHDGIRFDGTVLTFSELNDEAYDALVKGGYEAIGIDEMQFFDIEIALPTIRGLVEQCGRDVMVVGLDSTFEAKPFGYWISELMVLAEDITKLNAICQDCGRNNATRNYRIDKSERRIEVPGGSDKYRVFCTPCYRAITATDARASCE